MNKIEEARVELEAARADMKEILDFIEQVGKWSTGPIRTQCNVLLTKHGRDIVPLHLPMLRAGPGHSQGRVA